MKVELPQFKMTSEFRLADGLRGVDMTLAFSNQADFSGISTTENVIVSEVGHKAFVDVNEEGTEAVAPGAVIVPTSLPPQPVLFKRITPSNS